MVLSTATIAAVGNKKPEEKKKNIKQLEIWELTPEERAQRQAEINQKYKDDFEYVYNTCASILSKPMDLLKDVYSYYTYITKPKKSIVEEAKDLKDDLKRYQINN